ncbi:hypothetical protein DFP72DRAFT_1068217 [Ephemerocybe angulata]|uniref:Uncharacterized protein n=1 Tax=Ephemerocybe angulata TaxID=980116 RepID=A0A8H6M6C6_9AGAR|nr:hypothetical protein DFP72DRAFT_1068217 [Tulosesus angulatus]
MGRFKVLRKPLSARQVSVPAPAEALSARSSSSSSGSELALAARAVSPDCLTGGFYKSPTTGSTISSSTPLLITWDPTCLTSPSIDIYLYAPGLSPPRIHLWQALALSRGSYEATLMPRWWNATETAALQLQIVGAGEAPFLSTLPAGPVFTATYTPPANGVIPPEADTTKIETGITVVNDLSKSSSSLSKGKTAVAVLLPLILIVAGVLGWMKWKRSKAKEEKKTWTEKVDRRMSTISADWKSVTNVGAQAAVRASMAANRASSFSFGGPARPSSQFERDVTEHGEKGDLSQRRPGVGLRNQAGLANGERVSRVSFAADPRPSGESRRTKAFRDSYVPPVPSLPANTTSIYATSTYNTSTSNLATAPVRKNSEEESEAGESEGSGAMSPTQTEGALSLTPEAIRARIAAGRARSASRAGVELMRTGHTLGAESTDDLLFSIPTAPAATYSSPLAAGHGHTVNTSNPFATYITPTASHTPSYSTQHANTTFASHQNTFSNGAYAGSQAYGSQVYGQTAAALSPDNTGSVASPVMSSIPMPAMQAMPASVMSPDEMLRAYAERKKSAHMSSSHLSSSHMSLSSNPTGVGSPSPLSLSHTTTGAGVGGYAVPAPPAPVAGGRTVFDGQVGGGGNGEKGERPPSLGFAPGEYDPDFKWEARQ